MKWLLILNGYGKRCLCYFLFSLTYLMTVTWKNCRSWGRI